LQKKRRAKPQKHVKITISLEKFGKASQTKLLYDFLCIWKSDDYFVLKYAFGQLQYGMADLAMALPLPIIPPIFPGD